MVFASRRNSSAIAGMANVEEFINNGITNEPAKITNIDRPNRVIGASVASKLVVSLLGVFAITELYASRQAMALFNVIVQAFVCIR